jgi:hypothetical protein
MQTTFEMASGRFDVHTMLVIKVPVTVLEQERVGSALHPAGMAASGENAPPPTLLQTPPLQFPEQQFALW